MGKPHLVTGQFCVPHKSSLALQQGVQRAEGMSQLQDWNMQRKDLEARRQTGELENGNAEE